MAGVGDGDVPLIHGTVRTGAVDTGWGGGDFRVYVLWVQWSPSV